MPEISRFLGIVVRMDYRDHLPPHLHARYGSYSIVVQLDTWIVEERSPPRALRQVLEWAELLSAELQADRTLALSKRALQPIPPLE